MGFELQSGHLGEGSVASPGSASPARSLGTPRRSHLPSDESPARWGESGPVLLLSDT